MVKIHSRISELDMEEELSTGLKQRNINHKFMYINNGADIYYNSVNALGEKTPVLYKARKFYKNFIREYIPKNKIVALISLGCGDARQEKELLKNLCKQNYKVTYFGVDTSKEMLNLADKNLKEVSCEKQFICADIMTKRFKKEIMKITKDFDKRILAFLGCTFSNHNQTEITDGLYNMIGKKDLLRFDVFTKPENSQQSDYQIFKRYEKMIKTPYLIDFFFFPLKHVGITLKDCVLKVKTKKEESLGSLLFHFYFKLKNDINITFKNEIIHMRKTQEVGLIDVRAYWPETLIKFFEGNDFKNIKHEIEEKDSPLHKGQFLFQKN